MPSVNSTLAIARRALLAHQTALSTTGENIANVNTPGYARRRAEFTQGPRVIEPPGLVLGSGSQVERVIPVRDQLIEAMISHAQNEQAYYSALSESLQALAAGLGNIEGPNLPSALSQFWDAWHTLARDPSSLPARVNLQQVAQGLVSQFHQLARHLNFQRSLTNQHIENTIKEANQLLSRLAQANGNLTGSHGQVIDDERLEMVERLSALTGATYRLEDNGALTIQLGTTLLLQGTVYHPFNITPSQDGNYHPSTLTIGDVPIPQLKGELGGVFEFLIQDLLPLLSHLDSLAVRLVQRVNALHLQGWSLNGLTNIPFFHPETSGIQDIALAEPISRDPRLIVASLFSDSVDNTIALQIAGLEEERNEEGKSISEETALILTAIGTRAGEVDALRQSAQLSYQQIANWRDAVSGVSLDEELTDLLRFENGYRAAARLISTVQTMMESILEMVR